MKLFKKTKEESKGSSITRLSRMSTPDLHTWFNTNLMGLGRSFDLWRYEDGPEEVEPHLEALNEIWKEIKHRNNGN